MSAATLRARIIDELRLVQPGAVSRRYVPPTGQGWVLTDDTDPAFSHNKALAESLANAIIPEIASAFMWQEAVLDRYDPTTATPATPTTGDRYLSTATANGWTIDYIYEWNGSAWVGTAPENGMAAVVMAEGVLYVFDGSEWVALGVQPDHGVTVGTLPKASGAKTWANSLLTESASTIGLSDSKEFSLGGTLTTPIAKLWSDTTYGRHLANYPPGSMHDLLTMGEAYYCDTGAGPIVYQKTSTPPSMLNVTNWNTAYGWGNHASAGYLTDFVESDPVFQTWIGTVSPSNWNAAYGWGNHASAGYLTANAAHGVTSGTIPKSAGTNAWSDSLLVETATGIGLGIATPDTKLHVWGGSAGTVSPPANTLLTLESSGILYQSFLTPDNTTAGIKFGTPTNNDIARILHIPVAGSLMLSYNDTAYVTLKSSQVTIASASGANWIDFQWDSSGNFPYPQVAFLKDNNRLRFGNSYTAPDSEMYSDGTYGRHLANYPPGSMFATLAVGEVYYCDIGGGPTLFEKTGSTPPSPSFITSTITSVIRGATSLYSRYYHIALGSTNPGASGAAWIVPSVYSVGGWRINSDTKVLSGNSDVHADWDGASDLTVEVYFESNVDNSGGQWNHTVDLNLTTYYKGIGDEATKSQTQRVSTTVGACNQYAQFKAEFTIDWDKASNVVEVGDILRFVLAIDTGWSEVDDVIINNMSIHYSTAHIGIESGDV
jgi:hypothetical protein